MKGIYRRILVALLIIVIIAVLGVLAERYTSLDWLVRQESRLRTAVASSPVQAWVLGFGAYVILSLIPGTTGKAVIVGWLFGFWPGLVMVDIALTISALITFLVSRALFREAIEQRFGIHLAHFRRRMQVNGGFYLLTLRMMHAPYSFVNYAAGATNIVPAATFWWSTLFGLLPVNVVFVLAGTRIPKLSVLAEKGVLALLDGWLIAALAGTAVLPVVIRWIVGRMGPRDVKRNANCGPGEM